MLARLIAGGLQSHIYVVTHGGFDTHSNQAGGHAGLLQNLGASVAAFMEDLEVIGRRIAENGSGGTDHGDAAPMFLNRTEGPGWSHRWTAHPGGRPAHRRALLGVVGG